MLWHVLDLILALEMGYLGGSAVGSFTRDRAKAVAFVQANEYPEHQGDLPPISTLKVLIIEDELDVSLLVESMLRELGCCVVWRCRNTTEALALLHERRPDAAILDIRLEGESVYPVAAQLDVARIPFLFASGDRSSVPTMWARRPRIAKPFGLESLAAGLASALAVDAI